MQRACYHQGMQGSLFFAAAACVLGAVAFGFMVPVNEWFVGWVIFMVVIAVCAAHLLRLSPQVPVILGACLLMGVLRVSVVEPVRTPLIDTLVGNQVTVHGILDDEVDAREGSARLTIAVSKVVSGDREYEVSTQVVALVAPHPPVAYGDSVSVTGTLHLPEAFETDTGRLFNYPGYLAVSGVGYLLHFAYVEEVAPGPFSVKRSLFALKEKYLDALALALSEPQAALAGGITVGDKRALGGPLLDAFRDSGIIHIVVLSGYNITIIIAFLLGLMLSWSRALRVGGGVCIIVLFVLMTGATATGVRAGIMAGIALLALVAYRRYDASRALAVAAVAMVLYNPRVLLFDPGFQLSAVATAGLLYVAPYTERRIMFVPNMFGLREIMATTIGTQLAVLPLLLFLMGEISLVAIIANVLVLPVVPLAMLLSFLAALSGAVAASFGVVVGYPAYLLLSWVILVAERSAAVPFATTSSGIVIASMVLGGVGLLWWGRSATKG